MNNSVKVVATIILVISVLATLTNLGGAIVSQLLDFDIPGYFYVCIFTASVGFLFAIGSFYMLKSKTWTRNYLLYVSKAVIIIAIAFSIYAWVFITFEGDGIFIKIISVIAIVFFGAPLFFLIRFLNTDKVKSHFA